MDWKKLIAILMSVGEGALPFIPHGELFGVVGAALAKYFKAEADRSGKSFEQIAADAGLSLDSVDAKVLEDLAKGE